MEIKLIIFFTVNNAIIIVRFDVLKTSLNFEIEIHEPSDADFFPEKCSSSKLSKIKRIKQHFREISDFKCLLLVAVSILISRY